MATRDQQLNWAVDVADGVEGWMPRPQLHLLASMAAEVDADSVIIEVGTYRGRSAVALALGAASGAGARVYTFDPHLTFQGARGGSFGPHDQAELYANLTRTGVGAGVFVASIDSTIAARGWPQRNVGMLFIDGDHRMEAVLADVRAWAPHLRDGTPVVFDDFDYHEVMAAIAELEQSGVIEPLGTDDRLGLYRSPGRS